MVVTLCPAHARADQPAKTSLPAQTPLVGCALAPYAGITVCQVDISAYGAPPTGAGPACPAGVTSSTSLTLCAESFAAALRDAKLYFANPHPGSNVYLLTIPAGRFDFSVESKLAAGVGGAIDVTNIVPGGAGCLNQQAELAGNVVLTANGCLVISGAGPASTVLTTAHGITGIYGKNVSHIMVQNITMVQPDASATQAVYVGQGMQTFSGLAYPTVTMDFAPGFPTPLALYKINCDSNPHGGCSPTGLAHVTNSVYSRAYTNTTTPQLIQSIAGMDDNGQLPWGLPTVGGTIIAASPPVQPDPKNYPNRWTLTLSGSRGGLPSYYTGSTNGVPNLICMKVDDAEAVTFNALPHGGNDIVLNNMAWVGASRATFRGITAARDGSVRGAQILNSIIQRGPPVRGVQPCLSSQSGGLQFGHPTDPPVYGNLVYGLTALNTGDDSIAMFNDVGGTPAPHHGTYPQTLILNSAVANSFARSVLLFNDHLHSKLTGNSPVLVDPATQLAITTAGNCDPLVLGAGNCPVTYISQ